MTEGHGVSMNDAPHRKVELHIRDMSPKALKGLWRHVRGTQRLRPPTIGLVILIYVLAILGLIFAADTVHLVIDLPVHGGDALMDIIALVMRIVLVLVIVGVTYNILSRVEHGELERYLHSKWPDRRAPMCYACSYDLKGTVGATCPECGEKIPWLEEVAAESETPSAKADG